MKMLTLATRVIKPENPRFLFSEQFMRTNFTFGDDQDYARSTYSNDYVLETGDRDEHALVKPTPILPELIQTAEGTKKHRLTVGHADKDCSQAQSLPHVQQHGSQQNEKIVNLEKKKMMQRTSVKFGNDGPQWSTAYKDFTAGGLKGKRRQPCAPPRIAEILPPPCRTKQPSGRSIVNSDYTYFGPGVSNSVLSGRQDALDSIQRIHTTDSVEKTLLGQRRKMMTRSMVDYRPPHQRVHGNNRQMVTAAESPYVRADSIWNSVHTGATSGNMTTQQVNYIWPCWTMDTYRYIRGSQNKVR